ncbi:MAG: YceI family protein [Chloroflexota bacterium]
MFKNKSNLGLIILLLVGLGLVIFIIAIAFRPAVENGGSTDFAFVPFSSDQVPQGATLFEIQSESSEARYVIGEILRGSPKTVIGQTDEVGGQLVVNFDNLPLVEFSDVAVLASTFQTDNSMRDGATRDRILFTNEFPLIKFEPETLIDLPESINVGDTAEFQIEGPLTIKGISNTETFEVIATVVSETEIDLFATTQIMRESYDLNVPNVPGVANVDEAVILELDLILTAVD